MLTVALIACSSEKKQIKTIRNLAIDDIKIQLQLPEGTKFNTEDIIVSEPITDLEDLRGGQLLRQCDRGQRF